MAEDTSGSDEGDSTDSDSGGSAAPEEPAKTAEEKPAKTGGKGNLFGDSEEEASSDSPTKTEATKEAGPPKVKTKKSSIFDAE